MVCGHRAGDWLELRGENLTLPAGPVLFHLCAGGAPADPSGEAADDAPARLDDHRHRDRVSRPQLRRAVPHHPHRHAHVPPQRRDRRAAAAGMSVDLPARRARARLHRLVPAEGRLATGRRPRPRRRRCRAGRHGSVRRRGHHDLRLRGHLHRRRSPDRRVAEAARRARRRRACAGAHQVRARPRSAANALARRRGARRRPLARAPRRGPPRPGAAALVGLRRPGLRGRGRVARRAAPRRQDPAHRPDQLRPEAPGGNRRRRYPGRLAPGAVFRARPAARQRHRRTMRAQRHRPALLRRAGWRISVGPLPGTAPIPARRSRIDRS